MKKINVAIVGLGNCAGALVEGVEFYSKDNTDGLLFPVLGGYKVSDMNFVCAFDISKRKVNKTIGDAIYQYPNNFNRILTENVHSESPVYKGPTFDGNPDHLKKFFEEDTNTKDEDVVKILRGHSVDIVVNLLPTGSNEATHFYGMSALSAGCGFINCIPTIFAQDESIQKKFKEYYYKFI